MKIIRTARQLSRLLRMERAVRQAEMKFFKPNQEGHYQLGEVVSFPTRAPNIAEYTSLPPEVILDRLEKLELDPNLVFADLGSGLGMTCFAAAFHFKQVFFSNTFVDNVPQPLGTCLGSKGQGGATHPLHLLGQFHRKIIHPEGWK